MTEHVAQQKLGDPVFCVSAAFAALIAAGRLPHPTRPRKKIGRWIWIGYLSITSRLVLVIFALTDGTIAPQGWHTPYEHQYRCWLRQPIRTIWELPSSRGADVKLLTPFIFYREQVSSAVLWLASS